MVTIFIKLTIINFIVFMAFVLADWSNCGYFVDKLKDKFGDKVIDIFNY